MTTFPPVAADPYVWPYDGAIDTSTTGLMLIDWQTDFCGPGGYVDAMPQLKAWVTEGRRATG